MFTAAQPPSQDTGTESDDGGDTLWESDTESEPEDVDYLEAWDAQPKPRTYDEREARRLEKRERAAAKHRAAEFRSAENREGGALNNNAGVSPPFGI